MSEVLSWHAPAHGVTQASGPLVRVSPGVLRRRRFSRRERLKLRHPYAYRAVRNTALTGALFGALGVSGASRMRRGAKIIREATRVARPFPSRPGAKPGASRLLVVAPKRGWRREATDLLRSGSRRRFWAILGGAPATTLAAVKPLEEWGFERRERKKGLRGA